MTDILTNSSIAEGIAFQAEHCRRNGAPATGAVVEAALAVMKEEDLSCGERIRKWPGNVLEDAMPLRLAGGLHWLKLTGAERRLDPVYEGLVTRQDEIDALVVDIVRTHDHTLFAWFDSPPQTNESGRSSSFMAALLWLSNRVAPRFGMHELGASAGANLFMPSYRYDLGGVSVGPDDPAITITPEWRGPPPPEGLPRIATIRGCDQSPVDLTDDAQAMRVRAYIWPEIATRMMRLDAAIALAKANPPDLERADAADWVERLLATAQLEGTTRVIHHSIVWQYIPPVGRERITRAIEAAGAEATPIKPIAWIALETNRETFAHELVVRYWDGKDGDGTPHLLASAHAHGEWVEWYGK